MSAPNLTPSPAISVSDFTDPGDQKRGKSRRPDVRAPEPASLFDLSDQAPPVPMRVSSGTSIDAAKEISSRAMTQRRRTVLRLLQTTEPGLARFQIAQRIGVQDHVITSTVDALIKMRKIEEHLSLTVVNPASGRRCAVLVWIDAGDMEGAA